MLSVARQEDLRACALASNAGSSSESEAFKNTLVSNIAAKVASLAKKSKLSYSLDQPTLTRVLGNYLDHLSCLPKDATVFSVKEQKKQVDIRFGDFCYSFKGIPDKPTWRNKTPEQPWSQQQGVFASVQGYDEPQLIDGKMVSGSQEVHEGRFAYVPSKKKMELVDGMKQYIASGYTAKGRWELITVGPFKDMCLMEGQITDRSGLHYDGRWTFWFELGIVLFAEGQKISPDGLIENGVWAYEPLLHERVARDGKTIPFETLRNGKKTYPDGRVEEGMWVYNSDQEAMQQVKEGGSKQWIPALGREELVDGGRIDPATKHIEMGHFKYIPELKAMCLVQGGRYDSNGNLLSCGAHEYIPALNAMALTQGAQFNEDGTWSVGTHQYLPQAGRMCLTEGFVLTPDFQKKSGVWKFDPLKGNMVLVAELEESKLRLYKELSWFVEELTCVADQCDPKKTSAPKMESLRTKMNEVLGELSIFKFQKQADEFLNVVHSTYRTLALFVHPDKQAAGASLEQKQAAEAAFERLQTVSEAVKQKREAWVGNKVFMTMAE